MTWLGRLLGGSRPEPGPLTREMLTVVEHWLETAPSGHEKEIATALGTLAKTWGVQPREETARGVLQFFEDRLTTLETGTTGLMLSVDTHTDWWGTPSGHILSLEARFDRVEVNDRLLSGRLYQVGRVSPSRFLVIGR